ncbi:MAG: acylphosphatase [Chloroflexi bacterium]|nr:acylphosphatase [Chloroflexota bacterium]
MATPQEIGAGGQGRLRALVRGRVQGVYFRQFAREHTGRLRLTGWVRNLPDGSTVEVVAEGPMAALEELLGYLREGPPGAEVHGVEVSWEQATGSFSVFNIRGG